MIYVRIENAEMRERANIHVSGRVQGVFFRDHTRRWASSLGLTGWVRNLVDGRVEAVVEGERKNVETLISRLKEGPPMARVDALDVEWQPSRDEFTDFRITW